MAHECPDCGSLCYCDWEDCFNNFPGDIENCTHYLTEECQRAQAAEEAEYPEMPIDESASKQRG